MILAGDVGGTKTLLGLFDGADRPRPLEVRSYPTAAFGSFAALLEQFARDLHQPLDIQAAAVGVAGPVIAGRARLTNLHWDVTASELASTFGTKRVHLLNDLEALACSVEVLSPDELEPLHEGLPRADGNAAVIAAGTGLGQAYLHRIGGRLIPIASEGGHADFAPRTDREIELLRMLRAEHGRAAVEHVLSGPGLVNLHRFTHRGGECAVLDDVASPDAPARISQAGMGGRCGPCSEALQMFVAVYGAEAGNLALRGVATSGLFVGGGIAPKILPVLRSGRFMEAFLAKPPMTELLSRIPVNVILNPEAGLLGAAVCARRLALE